MNILIVNNSKIPAKNYGGTERVIWYLGKELSKLNHKVFYLVYKGSYCDFAKVLYLDESKTISEQIPDDIDIVHFNSPPIEPISKPCLVTVHGNCNDHREFNINAVFVSKNHAARFGSNSYVYNGLDWDDYTKPQFTNLRSYFHFLGNASWRVKNVKGAIDVIKATPSEKLRVLGGQRLNFKMGFRFTISPRISFEGMVDDNKKISLLQNSKGLIFPVKWHEPFGLAIIESLYIGCPVFGTPYGSLPEIVNPELGFLSSSHIELAKKIQNAEGYNKKRCHQYATDVFNSKKMAESYIEKYNIILNGQTLNEVKPRLIKIQTEKFLPWI